MRSTNQIIQAVLECEECTEEELRLCIMSLKARLYFAEKAADDMAAATEKGLPATQMRAGFWKIEAEQRFASITMPVDKYLGPGSIPGTSEQVERLRVSKAIFEKATGEKLYP